MNAPDLSNDVLAVLVAKSFGGYDDLEWARLEPRERAWLRSKGYRTLDAFAPVFAALAEVRDRLDRLTRDHRETLERGGDYGAYLVASVNLYSDACRDIEAVLGRASEEGRGGE